MRIRIVNAFTDRPFGGNPAGVLLLDADGFPPESWLQQVAAQVNLSETAFAHPLPAGSDADWALRWLTPTTEVDLCGHATLATAHVLHTTGAATGTIRFTSRSGILSATVHDDDSITLDFPTAPLTPVDVPETAAAALGAQPLAAYDTGQTLGDLLLEMDSEQTVRMLTPDHGMIERLDHRGLIVTAPAEDPARGYDFVSRFFGAGCGIDEDPVTGSAHTALAPLWSERLSREALTGLQVSARSGVVRTTLHGARTLLTGSAVTVIDGELLTTP